MKRSKQFTVKAVVWAIIFSICPPGFGKIIYVDDNATAPGDGSSWQTAYKYLQDALADAKTAEKPVEVRVAQGVYKPNRGAAHPQGSGERSPFMLFGGIMLRGGYAGLASPHPNARNAIAWWSVLSGDLADNDSVGGDPDDPRKRLTLSDNSERVVKIQGADPILLEGFVITGGYVAFGGRIIERPRGFAGGGLNISSGSDATIKDCMIRANHTDYDGGGMAVDTGAHARIVGCTFASNTAMDGGAASIIGDAEFTRCEFSNNRAWRGGGLVLHGSVSLAGCIISGNGAQEDAGAIWVSGGRVRLTNCVILANSAPWAGVGALHACFDAAVTVTNSVLWQNQSVHPGNPGSLVRADDGATIALTYCDIQGGSTGPGNIDADPLFADLGQWDSNNTPDDPNDDFFIPGDYHLKSQAGRWDPATESWVVDDVTSPCIDAGDPNSPIGQEPFPNGGRINMGAYGGTAEAGKSYFGKPPCETIIAGDINGDCKVDLADLLILVNHWLQEGQRAGE